MKAVTPEQMNEIDRLTASEIGIPRIVLMENAALAVFREIGKSFPLRADRKILLFAGKGNNGGDALALARHLFNAHYSVQVFLTFTAEAFEGDAALNLAIIEKMGIEVSCLTDDSHLEKLHLALSSCGLIIDGIFGTGLKGEVTGMHRKIIDAINGSGKTVLSIDIPSGICGATGGILGVCVRAAKTVTFCLPKTGLLVNPASEKAGKLIVADIGIPEKIIDRLQIQTHLLDKADIAPLVPARWADSNKGSYGRAFIITGSTGMTGAGCLAGRAALRSGAGLAYLGVPATLASIYGTVLVEAVTIPLDDAQCGSLSSRSLPYILERASGMSVVAVGPGLGGGDDIFEIVSALIRNSKKPLVLDADALNALSGNTAVLKESLAEIVITPHPGEMARLMGVTVQAVLSDRLSAARNFAALFGVIVVLKGDRTVIATSDGSVFVNPTGNPGMATAGSGDVLTGFIAGLIAQGATPLDAAKAAVFLHGMAADLCAQRMGEHGIMAGDIAEEIPYAIKQII